MGNSTNYVDTSALVSQNDLEMAAYVATPPDVDQVIKSIIGSTGANGIITVEGVSPARTAQTYEYDIDAAGSWANTTGVFTALADGAHTVQARDTDTPANVSVVLTLVVPAI
jgi:hypothetical protein